MKFKYKKQLKKTLHLSVMEFWTLNVCWCRKVSGFGAFKRRQQDMADLAMLLFGITIIKDFCHDYLVEKQFYLISVVHYLNISSAISFS